MRAAVVLCVRVRHLARPACLNRVHRLKAVEKADLATKSTGDHGRVRQSPLRLDRAVKWYKNTIQVQFMRLVEYLI